MARAWMAPVALCLLQSAQVGVVQDTAGKYRIAVGGSFGSYVEQTVSCNGDVVSEQDVALKSSGAMGDIMLTPTVRLTMNAGRVTSDPDGVGDGSYFGGGYGGVMIANERRRVGIGLGIESQPEKGQAVSSGVETETGGQLVPLIYLRAGNREGWHLRAEVGGPAAPGAAPDRFRLGVAHHWGAEAGFGWRLDIGSADFPSRGPNEMNYQGQIRFPVGAHAEIGVLGQLRSPSGGNLGVSGSWSFGKR